MMFSRRSVMAIVLAGAASIGGNEIAQDQAIVGIQTVTTYNADARITAVDPSARTVTLTYPDGAVRTVSVGAGVANFSSTRVGDNVTISFEDKRTFVLSGRNTPVPRQRDRTVAAAASMGQDVAGVAASKSITNWWVVGVDPAANTITLVSPNSGPVRAFNVTSQAGREQLPRVKVGDSLTDINSSLLAVSITPKA
jgi:hypothetical protein